MAQAEARRATATSKAMSMPTVDEPVKMWGGFGSGLPCDGCDVAVTSSEPEHEVEMPDGRNLRFHVACAGLWRALKQAMPKS